MEMDDSQLIDNAAISFARLKKGGQNLLDWYAVGAGLDVGVRLALNESGANDRDNKRYKNAFSKWMKGQEWAGDLDSATRTHALWLHENHDAVEELLATLDTAKRLKMNHPTTVRRAWDRAHNPKIEPEGKPKQVKIDAGELRELHDELDYLKADGVTDADTTARIEDLEHQLDEANAEIARLQARIAELEQASTQMDFVVAKKATKTKGEVRQATPEAIAAMNAKLVEAGQ
jgi:hypothetical protein